MTPRTGLVVIDMLNRYEDQDAELLLGSVHEILPALQALIRPRPAKRRSDNLVNDNYGNWAAGPDQLREQALNGPQPRTRAARTAAPNAAFVTKARHSIFYETSLEYLLRSQRIERLILTGQVPEQCVLYSALDAYVRHYQVVIPRNAVAHIHPDLADAALRMMQTNMRAQITDTDSLAAELAAG